MALSDFIKEIEKELNNVQKLRDAVTGGLAYDEAMKFAAYLAYVRRESADKRAAYQKALWNKLQETDGDRPVAYNKAEAFARAQDAYSDYLRLEGLSEAIVDLGHALRGKARMDEKEYQGV